MGWDNWNAFGCDVSEDLLLGTAREIASSGLRDAGYHYVVLDDCWATHERNSTGHLVANATRFPNGMKDVGYVVHEANHSASAFYSGSEAGSAG